MAVTNPFNFILAALGIVSIATGDKATFTVMMVMVIASTGLRFVQFYYSQMTTGLKPRMKRFWQELKSVSQAAKLLSSVTTRIQILRNNQEVVLDRKEVVPGDVLVLTSSLSACSRWFQLTYGFRRRRLSWRLRPVCV